VGEKEAVKVCVVEREKRPSKRDVKRGFCTQAQADDDNFRLKVPVIMFDEGIAKTQVNYLLGGKKLEKTRGLQRAATSLVGAGAQYRQILLDTLKAKKDDAQYQFTGKDEDTQQPKDYNLLELYNTPVGYKADTSKVLDEGSLVEVDTLRLQIA
jgi:hypothetical protein